LIILIKANTFSFPYINKDGIMDSELGVLKVSLCVILDSLKVEKEMNTMFTGRKTKQGHYINKQLLIVFFTLILTLLISVGCGGGKNEAKECIAIKIDKISAIDNGSFAQGTFTNNCSQQIKSSKFEITCFSPSGAVVERHPKIVTILPSGAQVIFRSVMGATPDQIKNCSGEVLESSY
jgi:hypothetical protein